MSQISRDINTIDRHLRRHRREYMEPLGLKGIHARLIMTVCRRPGRSQEQIARSMWFDKSTIARHLELMEEKGFITRKPSVTDKRVLCVFPTEKMLQFQPGLGAAMETWEEELLQDLTDEEKQQFSALLARVCARTNRGD